METPTNPILRPTFAISQLLRRLLIALALFGGLTACSTQGIVTGNDGRTANAGQSETGAATSYSNGSKYVVVSFNDETDNEGKIIYGATSRKILAGASLMGWAYSSDKGATWTYGGKVSPPPGWSALWGDPAMTTSGAHAWLVFMVNLAMPISKFPQGGIDGYVYYGNGKSSYIGGACIARSTDGGRTFANHRCVSNKDAVADAPGSELGHFYDGGTMASFSTGEIFAAFVDVATSKVDVWRAPDHNQDFVRIATPFPDMIVASHPRLRASRDNTLYAAAQIATGYNTYHVYLNRYVNGAWGRPILASDPTELYPEVDMGSTVLGSPLTVRTGPQFSFDVGAASEGGRDAIRLLYTRKNPQTGLLYVEGSACAADLSSCHIPKREASPGNWVPAWRFGFATAEETPKEAFNPNVAAWGGFIGLPPVWQGSFLLRYGRSQTAINLTRSSLGYVNGVPFVFPVDIAKNAPVCSDTRGYWGDYDEMLHIGFRDTSNVFARFLTDSSKGCTQRWQYVGRHQHVRAVTYEF